MYRQPLTRRRFVELSLGAASGLAMSRAPQRATAQEATPVPKSATVPSPNLGKDFGGKEIRMGTSTEYYAYALRMFQDQVEKEFNVKLKIDVVPATDMYQRNITEFTSGSTSYDVLMFLPFTLPDYAPHLVPLDDQGKKLNLDFKLDDVLPSFREIYSTWNGKIVSIPFDGDVHLLMYNKDAFENPELQQKFKAEHNYDLAIPSTYDQYLDMAKFFNENPWRKDGQKGYGVAEGYNGPEWWYENRLGSYGAVYFDENMEPLINGKNAIAAADNLVQTAKFSPPGSNSFGYQETENALVKGDVALSINWSSAYRTSTNPAKSTTVGRIGTAVTPAAMVNGQLNRRDALCTGWSQCVPKYSKNIEAATYIVWFYSQPAVHTAHIIDPDTGVDAYRVSSLDNEEFVASYGADYVKVIKDAIAVGFPDLQVPNAFEYYTSLDNGLKEAIAGSKSTADAMNGIAKEWKDITDRMGADQQKAAWNNEYDKMKAQGIKYIPMQ